MELRQLRHFVALADSKNFSRAAEKMHIAQPALSISIRKLEQELGVQLFDRGPRHVVLTEAGQKALSSARDAVAQADEVARTALTSKDSGLLRMSFVGSAAHQVLPRFLPEFRRQHKDVELELSEGPSLDVIAGVNEGSIDAGIVRHPVMQPTGLEMRILNREPLLVALPKRHALTTKSRIRLVDLAAEPFIQYSQTHAPSMNTVITLGCQRAGFAPRVAQEAIQIQTILSLVECGLGVALVPASSRLASWQKVQFRPLMDAKGLLTVGLCLVFHPKARNPRLPGLVDVLTRLACADALR